MSSTHKSLGHAALTGVFAGGLAQLGRLVIQLGSIALMARLLDPTDFGLVAMVTAVVGVADLLREMGLSAAAIQSETLSDDARSNLWWVNSGLGLLTMLLVMACGPLIVDMYHQPKLLTITWALAPMFLLNGMIAQFRASLTRRMRFTTLARIDVASQLVGTGIAIALALAGTGYWSLVAQQVLAPAIMLFVVQRCAGWMPTRFVRGAGTMSYLKFGWAVLGSGVLTYFALSFDSMVVGRFFGPSAVGVYNRAGQLIRTPLRQVAAPLNSVLLPVMSRVQDDDRRLSAMARRVQLMSTLPFVLAVAVLCGSVRDITDIFLGSKWGTAAPIMICIAIQSAFRMLSAVGAEIMTSRGLGRQLSELAAVTLVADVIAVLVGSHWGVNGTAIGVATAPLANWVISFWWIGKHSGVDVSPMVKQGCILTVISALVCLFTWQAVALIPASWHLVRIFASIIVGTAALSAVFLVPSMRADLMSAVHIVRSRKDK